MINFTFSKSLIYLMLLSVILGIHSCQNNDLSEFNPVLIASDERDLGDELFRTTFDNPSEFNTLDRQQYSKVYDYLNLAIFMVKNQTIIRDNFTWEVVVIQDDNSFNAFSYPGGKFGITTGLLKWITKEDQLFSIMAHEMYYNDRINQNSAEALSLVMDKLKYMVAINNGEGTKVFKDVINGTSDMNVDMVHYCMNLVYDPRIVFEADNYALNTILCPYTYSPMGIKQIIETAEQENFTNFAWLNNRPPSVSIDLDETFTLDLRKTRLEQNEIELITSSECNNSEESIDSDEYLEMIADLP